ncbi:flagellar filament capping protein FliD [Paraferrimonas sedimenticola]|uniref:Flagellar hook-associated protein 2 n=1 Tax=Paraferrimonas sedimenticola TaxID=375674 RepID=A0AA37RRF6_9GAMM|nr:flagellar filament capping protein FliD [Paraferrimonas sedimenticola]GLP94981.1 flagellar hook-associated protein 2 [Paraferrimonas sedimenticola]
MALTATGMGSGLDINAIVSSLVNAQKAPKEASFDAQESGLKAQISAFGNLKSTLAKFSESLESLSKASFFSSSTAELSKDGFFSVTTSENSTPGRYQVKVNQLASQHKVALNAVNDVTSPVGEGTVTLGVGGENFDIIVGPTDSLQDVMRAINDSPENSGVQASIVNSDEGARLVLTSSETGTSNALEISATNSGSGTSLTDLFGSQSDNQSPSTSKLTQLQQPLDAIIEIDGLVVTSSTNKVDNVINGISLDLTETTGGEPVWISVAKDQEKITEALVAFVDAYNEIQDLISKDSSYNAETESGGPLQGDSLVRGLSSQLKSQVMNLVDGKALSEFGITSDRYGKLEIDEGKMAAALEDGQLDPAHFFANSEDGLAVGFNELLERYTQTGGLLDGRDKSLNGQIDRIDDQREDLAYRMEALEARLYKQFNAMDLIVSQLNAQGASLQSRFDSLPGLVRT